MLSDRDLLTQVIGFDSTSGRSNLPLADFIAGYLDRSGVSVRRDASEDGERVNLIVRCGPPGAPAGSGLTLCGHLDVVPAEEPEWTTDPFELSEQDGRYVGRGACDMKGFIAVAINVFARAAEAPQSLKAPLCLLLTYDEELGSLGAQHLVAGGGRAGRGGSEPLPKSTIVGEPTSLRAVRLHKGHLKLRIVLRGRAAHSGSPHLGRNAVEAAGPILTALAQLRDELARQRPRNHEYFPEVPFAVLNAARIYGGHALNVIPDRCTIELGVRLLPGQSSDAIKRQIEGLVRKIAGDSGAVEVISDNPPLELPVDAEVNRTLVALLKQDRSYGVSFASDAGPLQQFGLECVLFGPGSIEVAHRANEFVPIEEMERCRTVLEELVRLTCQVDRDAKTVALEPRP